MIVGRSAPLTVQVLDSSGQAVDVAVRFAAPRGALRVRDGSVQGMEAGTYEIVATAALGPDASATAEPLTIPVTVAWPPVARLDVHASADRIFVGTTVTHSADAYHADGTRRPGCCRGLDELCSGRCERRSLGHADCLRRGRRHTDGNVRGRHIHPVVRRRGLPCRSPEHRRRCRDGPHGRRTPFPGHRYHR